MLPAVELEMESSSKPLLLVFKFAEGNDNEPPTLMDPFSQHNSNTNNPSAWRHQMLELKGKQCLACLQGQWLLMLDAASSNHCFFVSPLDDMTIISLPPLDTPLEPLRRCAISSSPLSPDCTIVFSTFMDTYLAYTRPGEDDWWQLDTDDDDDDELLLMGDIVSCQGKMYVPTDMSSIAMLDVSSYPPHIERRGIPEPSCIHSMANAMLVESQGEVFLLRHYGYGARDSELLDIDLHRLVHATDDGGDYVWRKVDTIGDRAIFVADNCVVMSDATKAGIRPDCVYLLHQRCRHGVRLYTIRLDDRTTTFTLLPYLTSNDSIYWLLPAPISSIVDDTTQHYSGAIVHSSSKIDQENGDGISVVDIASEQASPCWCGLPTDMVEEIVSKISLIDYFRLRQVCKGWSSIVKPIHYAQRYSTYPMLMSICSTSTGVYKLFDPIVEQEYTMKNNRAGLAQSQDHFQMLLFSSRHDGWVLATRGDKYMYATNPFTGEMFEFPEATFPVDNQFDGICLSAAPTSPDCIAFSVEKDRNPTGRNRSVYVTLWRAGDEQWTMQRIDDHTPFRTAYCNPVFYDGEFYCLGTRGGLANNTTWRVLDKPEAPVLVDGNNFGDDPIPGDMYCHLLEFMGFQAAQRWGDQRVQAQQV